MKTSPYFLFWMLFLGSFSACSYLPDIPSPSTLQLTETPDYIFLEPDSIAVSPTGFVFYPGGLVDPHAYIPSLEALVQAGYRVLIVKVSANLGILNRGKAQKLLADFPEVENWVIGGHSLGGVIACFDIEAEPERYLGLVLMASWPGPNTDLSDWAGASLSLYGENDLVAPIEEIEAQKGLLPPGLEVELSSEIPLQGLSNQTIYHLIPGGNHAGFGSYGAQEGDGIPTISQAAQHLEIADFMLTFFNHNGW